MGRNGYGPKWSWAEMVMGRNDPEPTMEVKSTAYTSLVRPVLDYASPAWDPTSTDDIVKLESSSFRAWQLF